MIKSKIVFLCNLLVCIGLFGCSSSEGIALGDLTIDENASPVIHLLNDDPYSGRVFQYEKGTEFLSSEFYLLDGVFNGSYVEFFPGGLLKHTAFFDKGILNGLEEHYFENGQLKEILFGRNEPALHHFHSNYRAALGQPELEKL